MSEKDFEKQKLQLQEKIFHMKMKLKAKDLDLKFTKETC